MADSGSEDESTPLIKLTLKSTSSSHEVELKANSTIKKVKEKLSTQIDQPVEKICLIFSGKILKDHDSLTTYNIRDGMAIHMVIRNQPGSGTPSRPAAAAPSSAGSSPAAAAPAPAPPTAANGPQLPGLAGMDMDGARRMMNSPMFQHLLNNPDILRNMISGSEQFQNIARQNPEIGQMLNDPTVIRQTLEMIRNPNMFNEMMRNHDQAIRNLQGIPGGEAALQRLYQDVQEPLLNSASSGGNPFASNNESNTESRSQRAGVENAEALPNPWGGGGADTNAPPSGNTTGDATAAAGAGFPGMPNISEMMSNPGMQEMMRNMMSNPEFMNAAMSGDMIQQARQLFGNNAPSADDMSNLTEQFRGAMSNPEVTSQMFKPRVVEAMNNIRLNIEVLRTEAPALYRQMFSSLHSSMGQMPTATGSSTNPTTAPNQTTATDAAAGTGQPPNTLSNPNDLLQFLSQMNRSGGAGGFGGFAPDTRPPEERFSSQLEQLVSMGFTNAEANLRAIQDSHGDVNAAIDRLLNPR